MKIAELGRISNEAPSGVALQEKQAAAGNGFSFKRRMSDLSREEYAKYLENLKDRILRQGEVIKKKADIGEFQRYRQLIAELAREAASNAYACSQSSGFDSKGKYKAFVTIKKINERLDEMAREILAKQSDNLKLVSIVDEIRGLLVDMFL